MLCQIVCVNEFNHILFSTAHMLDCMSINCKNISSKLSHLHAHYHSMFHLQAKMEIPHYSHFGL